MGTVNVRVRGIYATAISKILYDKGFNICHASKKIKERFGLKETLTPPNVTVKDLEHRQGVLVIGDYEEAKAAYNVLKEAIKTSKAKRVGIDSITSLYLTKPTFARNVVFKLKKVIAGYGCTAFFISQVSVTERGFGGPGVEHGVDGIIRLDLDEVDGELKRSLIVWKMRGTAHSLRRHYFEICDEGIKVQN